MGTKADLLQCLESSLAPEPQNTPEVDAIILDGAAIVKMLNPGTGKTFQDYAVLVFEPYIYTQLDKTSCADVVWDVYVKDSLKGTTREKRGEGSQKTCGPIYCDTQELERFSQLFTFLAQEITSLTNEEGKEIYVTSAQNVLCSSHLAELSNLTPCIQEEADTHLFLHVADAVAQGKKKATVHTVDIDVVALSVTFFSQMKPNELWIAFGTGKSFCFIAVHEILSSLTPMACSSLLAFHGFTGCDTVSSSGGRGKKTAWEMWKVFSDVADAFLKMTNMTEISKTCMSQSERFVVLMYDRTSECLQVNEARKKLFTQKSRTLENVPPSPSDWGWLEEEEGCQPIWTTLAKAAKSCYELSCCSCKKGCTRHHKCVKVGFQCTALCICLGDCSN